MLPDLSERAEDARELMDGPDADRAMLFRTYRHFERLNRLFAGWRRCYGRWIRPRLRAGARNTLLDVGFGGGDIPRALLAWARRDGFDLAVTAIERDPRATAFVAALPTEDGPAFRQATMRDLAAEGRRFDFVITNNVLHHLATRDVEAFRDQAEALTVRLALFNDIARGRLAYLAYALAAPVVVRGSFAAADGALSIRRSFTRRELSAVLGPRWRVRNGRWFRLQATFEP